MEALIFFVSFSRGTHGERGKQTMGTCASPPLSRNSEDIDRVT